MSSSRVPRSSPSIVVNGITANSATITWTTNVPSSSQVVYDATSAYGLSSLTDPALATSHSVTLMGLSPATLYHYQVLSARYKQDKEFG